MYIVTGLVTDNFLMENIILEENNFGDGSANQNHSFVNFNSKITNEIQLKTFSIKKSVFEKDYTLINLNSAGETNEFILDTINFMESCQIKNVMFLLSGKVTEKQLQIKNLKINDTT